MLGASQSDMTARQPSPPSVFVSLIERGCFPRPCRDARLVGTGFRGWSLALLARPPANFRHASGVRAFRGAAGWFWRKWLIPRLS